VTAIGARAVAAAAALKPLGLTLVVGPSGFTITDKPDDLSETVFHYPTIELVEGFIADHRRTGAARHTKPIEPRRPRVTDLVHYASHGTPVRGDGSQAYKSVCRAAMITEVTEVEVNEQIPAGDGIFRQAVGLMVANPTGQFFNRGVPFDPGTFTGPAREAAFGEPLPLVTCDDLTFEGGTWHWAGRA
jgi:hypothetical protein